MNKEESNSEKKLEKTKWQLDLNLIRGVVVRNRERQHDMLSDYKFEASKK